VVSASGYDSSVVDVCGEGFELPSLGDAKEGENVKSGQYGGQRGSLWGAMVQDNFREGFAIKGEGDAPVSEEGADPCTQFGCKTKDGEDVNQVTNMEVVKESLDVEEEEACNPTTFDACLDCVGHA